jgi:hypothetical protein
MLSTHQQLHKGHHSLRQLLPQLMLPLPHLNRSTNVILRNDNNPLLRGPRCLKRLNHTFSELFCSTLSSTQNLSSPSNPTVAPPHTTTPLCTAHTPVANFEPTTHFVPFSPIDSKHPLSPPHPRPNQNGNCHSIHLGTLDRRPTVQTGLKTGHKSRPSCNASSLQRRQR